MSIIDRTRTTVNPADESDPCEWPAWTDNWHYEPNDDTDADLAAAWDVPIASPDDEPAEEDRAEAAEVYAAMGAREHLDHGDRLTLAGLVDRQTDFYRSWGNDAGLMLAGAMERLAMLVKMTGATTPDEFDARVEVIEDDRNDTHRAIGWEEGYRAGRDERPGSAFGHDA